MSIEQVNEVITNYAKLVDLAKNTVKIIQSVDNMYDTGKGIEEVSFEKNLVFIKYDDSFRGSYSWEYFSFPIEFLSMVEDELKDLVTKQKELRIEEARMKTEEKQLKEKQDAEQRELEQYQRLKAKFE